MSPADFRSAFISLLLADTSAARFAGKINKLLASFKCLFGVSATTTAAAAVAQQQLLSRLEFKMRFKISILDVPPLKN